MLKSLSKRLLPGWILLGLLGSATAQETLPDVAVLGDLSSTNHPYLCRLVYDVDSSLHRYVCWFYPETESEQPPLAENRSILRLSPYYRTNDGGRSNRFKMSGRGELDLPLLSDFFDIRFSSEEDEEPNEELEDLDAQPGTEMVLPDVVLPGIDTVLPETDRRFWNDLGLNLRWDNGPEAGLRSRHGVTWDHGTYEITLDQSFWYRTDEGFGTKSRARWLHRINPDDRLHAQSDVNWEEVGRGLELDQLAGWYRNLPDFRRIGVRALAYEYTHPEAMLDAAYLRVYYRRAVFKDRVFLHVEPGLSWLEQEDFETLPTLFVRLETFWGKIDKENLGKFYRHP